MNHEKDKNLENVNRHRSRKNPKLRSEENKGALGEDWRKEAVRQTATARVDVLDKPMANGLTKEAEQKIRKARHRRRIVGMIIAECFALLFIFSYAYFAKRWNMIQRPPFDVEEVKNNDLDVETVEKMKGYWTIAIFGVDDRGSVIDKYTNADVNMVCNINMDTGEIRLVSVFRDTYLSIDDKGGYNKLNQAFFLGGAQGGVSALNRNLDLDIDSYVTFNWKAVAQAINILGGVDLDLTNAEFHYINSYITETVNATGIGSHHLTSPGMNHLDGIQAVAYGRLRKMDNDFARTERQRKVISLAFEKAKKADIGVLNNIAEVLFENIATNVELKDVIFMLKNISKYELTDTVGFPMARGDANMGKKGAVVVPQTLESNVAQLHNFMFGDEDYNPTEAVKNISAVIASDTGMYKEGYYVSKVSTEGGVIQPAKQQTAAETTKAAEPTEEDTKTTGSASKQTNENGNVIENASPAAGTTEAGTTPSVVRPGGNTETTAVTPGDNTEMTTISPGGDTETTSYGPGIILETTASNPGGNTETTASGPSGSSGSAGPGGGTSASAETTVSSAPTAAVSPGNSSPTVPGSSNSDTPVISGPGL